MRAAEDNSSFVALPTIGWEVSKSPNEVHGRYGALRCFA
jgi:hypothetical protein